jgi:hypothetical protein
MNVLNDAITREARGLPPANHFMNGNVNRPAVLRSFDTPVGRGFRPNHSDLLNPHFLPDLNQSLVPLDPATGKPYTAYPAKGLNP